MRHHWYTLAQMRQCWHTIFKLQKCCATIGTHWHKCANVYQYVPNLAHQKQPKKGPIFPLFSDTRKTQFETRKLFLNTGSTMPNLFQKLAGVENVAAVIETRLGLPQRRHLLFRHQVLNTARTAQTIEDYLVVPCPYITSAPPKLIGLLIGNDESAVSVTSTDIYVELSRTVPYDRFVRADGKRAIAFLDVQTNSLGNAPAYSNDITKTLVAGVPCRIIHISDSNDTLWKLVLRRDKD